MSVRYPEPPRQTSQPLPSAAAVAAEVCSPGESPPGLKVFGWVFFVFAVLGSLGGVLAVGLAGAATYIDRTFVASLIVFIPYLGNALYGSVVGFRLVRDDRGAVVTLATT